MQKILIRSLIGATLLLSGMTGLRPVFGAGNTGASEQIATLSADTTAIHWHAIDKTSRFTLSLSSPSGAVTRITSDAQGDIAITLNALSAGTYIFELRTPAQADADVAQALAQARETGTAEAVLAQLQAQGKLRPGLVQTGSFAMGSTGSVLLAHSAIEPSATPKNPAKPQKPQTQIGPNAPTDNVIADDLIVQGSACIGLDCVNNEIFGFDSLRLKENNLRVKFEDTSVSAGFASTDWQLTANDSASGGADKFSIEDITAATVPFTVLGGAPDNSLFIAANGKVGFRTTTPGMDAHFSTGDTPGIRLEQTAAAGFTPQTWDIAGNEANFFVRDVTGGSRLPLRIRPGAPTSSLDISSSGRVGIGTAAPQAQLHVAGSIFAEGNLTVTGNLVEHSDSNVKENFAPVQARDVLARLMQLPISTWNYKTDAPTVRHMGPMAQDFYTALGLGADNRYISPLDVNGALLATTQELYRQTQANQQELSRLRAANAELKAKYTSLEQRLAALEEQISHP